MLDISADKIAFVIIRARDYDQGTDGRGGRNAFELRDFIADLNDDEQAALTAVMWIGRGTFEPEELAEAMATARAEKTTPTEDYLMGEPRLATIWKREWPPSGWMPPTPRTTCSSSDHRRLTGG